MNNPMAQVNDEIYGERPDEFRVRSPITQKTVMPKNCYLYSSTRLVLGVASYMSVPVAVAATSAVGVTGGGGGGTPPGR